MKIELLIINIVLISMGGCANYDDICNLNYLKHERFLWNDSSDANDWVINLNYQNTNNSYRILLGGDGVYIFNRSLPQTKDYIIVLSPNQTHGIFQRLILDNFSIMHERYSCNASKITKKSEVVLTFGNYTFSTYSNGFDAPVPYYDFENHLRCLDGQSLDCVNISKVGAFVDSYDYWYCDSDEDCTVTTEFLPNSCCTQGCTVSAISKNGIGLNLQWRNASCDWHELARRYRDIRMACYPRYSQFSNERYRDDKTCNNLLSYQGKWALCLSGSSECAFFVPDVSNKSECVNNLCTRTSTDWVNHTKLNLEVEILNNKRGD
mgnify:FL=1